MDAAGRRPRPGRAPTPRRPPVAQQFAGGWQREQVFFSRAQQRRERCHRPLRQHVVRQRTRQVRGVRWLGRAAARQSSAAVAVMVLMGNHLGSATAAIRLARPATSSPGQRGLCALAHVKERRGEAAPALCHRTGAGRDECRERSTVRTEAVVLLRQRLACGPLAWDRKRHPWRPWQRFGLLL